MKDMAATPDSTERIVNLSPAMAAFRKPATPALYTFWMLPAVLIMAALPALYVALVALAGYAVYYHGAHNFHPIMIWGGIRLNWRLQILKLAVYFGPLFGGAIMVLFMVKPIFARPPKPQPYTLNPDVETELYAFISGICRTVGAPIPRRIDLNCELNASASFRRGFLSFLGHDMVLTLGLPLLGSLSVEEFAGVLAHEFGHFTQGMAMRLHYIIARVNNWFARVVFERDSWDKMLAEWSFEVQGVTMSLIVACANFGVWFSRVILRLFMMAGLAVSGSLSRQMEFNADAYQINLVGSETAERLIRRLTLVSHALIQSRKEMTQMWRVQHTLPQNLSQYLALKLQSMPDATKARIDDTLGLAKTRWFASHPCDADRIRQARRLGQPALIACAEPASRLFANFEIPARAVTLFYYHELRIPITARELTAFRDEAKARREQSEADSAALDRYFCGALPLLHPVTVPPRKISAADVASLREQAGQFRARIEPVRAQIQTAAGDFTAAEARAIQMAAAKAILESGGQIDAAQHGLAEPSAAAAQQAETEALEAQRQAAHALRVVTDALRSHFTTTLALSQAPSEAEWLPEGESDRMAARPLASFLNQFAPAWPLLMECRREHAALAALSQLSSNLAAQAGLGASSQRLEDLLARLRDATVAISNPFQKEKRPGCIFDQLTADQSGATTAGMEAKARSAVEGFMALYEHALAQLAEIAERVESEC
ncbi:MAG TPA: M48 family metallopeptidase [Verrucomicrobiae bacterium]